MVTGNPLAPLILVLGHGLPEGAEVYTLLANFFPFILIAALAVFICLLPFVAAQIRSSRSLFALHIDAEQGKRPAL